MNILSTQQLILGANTISGDGSNGLIINGINLTGSLTGSFLSLNKTYRANTVNIGNLATTQLVAFSSPMPNTGYSVGLVFDSTLGAATSASATLKTISGFTIGLSAGIAGGVNIDWNAWLYN